MKTFTFGIRKTPRGAVAWMQPPSGSLRQKRFRNGYAGARISARKWIALQIQDIETECLLSNRPCPDIYVDGVQVVSSNPPTVRQCIDVLRRVVAEVTQREPESRALVEAACDADELIVRYERSRLGRY